MQLHWVQAFFIRRYIIAFLDLTIYIHLTSSVSFQFQLLMAMVAIERIEAQQRNNEKFEKTFAKKSVGKALSESLQEFFRDIGISKFEEELTFPTNYPNLSATNTSNFQATTNNPMNLTMSPNQNRNLFTGTVIAPASERPQDMYHSSLNHSRQSMLLRMEHLFDEVESKLVGLMDSGAPILTLLATPGEEIVDGKARLPTKPVVIGDALPVPSDCPESVEQLLEASLAHHNLGSFEESLKFLEAARVQLQDIVQSNKNGENHFDIQMYIIVCKGNVYQSCGDDEQSLIQYIDGWTKAKQTEDKDWEIICVNSIGMLAFFSLRYEVSLLCFNTVYEYREQVSF